MEDNDMFGADAPVEEEVVATEEVIEQPVETPEVQQEVPVEPVKPQIPEGYVPVGVVKELREEIRQLRQPQQPVEMPQPVDIFEDPDGFRSEVQRMALSNKLDLSEAMNAEKYGDDAVEAAKQWAQQKFHNNPSFANEVFGQRDPYGYVIKTMRKEEAAAKLGDVDPSEIDQFRAWKAAQAAVQPVVQQATPIPPKSLASAPNAGDVRQPAKVTPEEERIAQMFG
ncbi:scaffolding protein [Pseudanabaena phage Pam1]|nr:scaffolding protein [Pseudanabaena phage Pam1]